MMPFSQIYRVESTSKRDFKFVMSEIILYGYEYQDFSLLQTGYAVSYWQPVHWQNIEYIIRFMK